MIATPNIQSELRDRVNNNVFHLVKAGAPTSGTSGDGAGFAGPRSSLVDITNNISYVNTNTMASPTWTAIIDASTAQTLTNKTLTSPVINQPNLTPAVQALTAAGSSQADAAAITVVSSGTVYVTGANATKGVLLPVGSVGMVITIVNDAATNAVLKVYGNTGDSATINNVSGATAYSMAAKTSVDMIFVAAAKWQSFPLVAS